MALATTGGKYRVNVGCGLYPVGSELKLWSSMQKAQGLTLNMAGKEGKKGRGAEERTLVPRSSPAFRVSGATTHPSP